MKQAWVDFCVDLCCRPATFFDGNRKIMKHEVFEVTNCDRKMTMADGGYTDVKMTMLRKLYLHEASRDAALMLWNRALKRRKYSSVGFHCFNHELKGHMDKGAKLASKMGPCLQAVTITYQKDHTAEVTIHYRTTEVFKKFAADLVFIVDELLEPFDFTDCPIQRIRFQFDNLTVHPMYFAILYPHLDDPFETMETIRGHDPKFYDYMIKQTARYIIPEFHRGIQNHSQSMSVSDHFTSCLSKQEKRELSKYLKKNHPGYRRPYQS